MLSEVVAGISRVTPYSAPAPGYFDAFPGQVFSQVNETLSSVFQEVTKTPFEAPPAGYFENLASNMLNRIRSGQPAAESWDDGSPLSAGDELAKLSPLLHGIGKKLPFQVPEGYFNNLLAQLSGSLDSLAPGSLDSLALNPLGRAAMEEDFSPLLAGLQQAPTYRAPEGYFAQFPDQMLARVGVAAKEVKTGPARVISMGRKQQWWKLGAVAAAASVILVVGWLSLRTPDAKSGNPAVNPDITKSLSNVSDLDIQNYLDNQNIPLADQLANSIASVDITDNDENSMLGDVSDAELKQYLEDHGNAKELPKN